jgi:hypothetical protein
MTKQRIRAVGLTALTLALGFALTPAVHRHFTTTAHAATTIIAGDLFYTTFQTQSAGPGPNVYRTSFVYDNTPSISYSGDCLVASLAGADGLIFDPNDSTNHTLVVGEQNSNRVASLAVANSPNACPASGTTERKADASAAQAPGTGQAYGLGTPDNTHLWMLPNDASPKPNFINTTTLPLTTDGVSHQVTGDDTNIIRGVAFIGTQGYYGDATDNETNLALDGHFGTIALVGSNFVTARVAVVDNAGGDGTTNINGQLPTHGMSFDPYSECIIASGSNLIWQLCPAGKAGAPSTPAGAFHVMAKIATASSVGGSVQVCKSPGAADCNHSNWDQTSLDGLGHMFAANNNGDIFFRDFSSAAPHLISTNNFSDERYLRVALDDIVNGGGAPVTPLTLTCPPSTGTVGVPYVGSLVATGGTAPYTFSIFSGTLPPPLQLNSSTGAITGTPTTPGTFNFTGKVVDSTTGTALTKTTDCSITIPQTNLGCVLTPGGYKNRFSYKVIGISFKVGATTYTYSASQVLAIISTGGGGSNALGRSLFTALLNIHYGAFAPDPIPADILAAEALYVQGKGSDALNTALDDFNNGLAPGGPTQECTQ